MYIDFTTPDGQSRQVKTLGTFHTAAAVGDTHPIIYLPSQPENAKIYSARQLWLPMTVGTVFSIACTWGGLRLLRRRAPADGLTRLVLKSNSQLPLVTAR
jgi:hypothetical protein